MNVQAICDHLKPLLAATFKDVRPARKLEADIRDRAADLPLLLVHPWKEEAGQPQDAPIVRQRIAEHFALISICPIENLSAVRDQLFNVLLGDVLPGHEHEVIYQSGETLDLDASVIWWRDIFTTHLQRRQQP